ncbi:MAG: hypothetical protein KDB86_10770, partial [Actinobacteria bacterium]|nr:hypothetical protein [Actinomycetota bacterium]
PRSTRDTHGDPHPSSPPPTDHAQHSKTLNDTAHRHTAQTRRTDTPTIGGSRAQPEDNNPEDNNVAETERSSRTSTQRAPCDPAETRLNIGNNGKRPISTSEHA